MDYCAYFKDKRITVMGLGLLGRGVGDTEFLAECGAELIVTDLKDTTELKTSLDALKGFSNITYRLGEHRLEDFKNRDMVLKAAGVPDDSPYLQEARKNNITVEMSASLFAKLSNIPIIGVTGTRGKSTVTQLIYEISKAAEKHVLLGGNIRGKATLPLLKEVTGDPLAVFELDSWQLQGFGESKISPHIAVFTTFLPDHMNYYKGDMDRYLEDKANIFKYQNKDDILVLGSQCAELIKGKYPNIQSEIIVADPYDTRLRNGQVSYKLKLLGEHNRYNAACAAKAAQALGIPEEVIRKTIAEFKGVPGRLEFIREYKGIKIYNDTTATTPEATIAALNALGETKKKNVVLIMGGADKGLDMSELYEVLPQFCKSVIALAGTGTDRMREDLERLPQVTMIYHSNLRDAVAEAVTRAKSGDIILLSPAFASFGMFKNEFDRGDQFVQLVKNLNEKS